MSLSVDLKLSELVCLLNGDKQAVKRLVTSAMNRYPGHRAVWYVDKCIEDLKRDRGVR